MLQILKKTPWRKKKPRVPAGVRLYVIADVHGRADALRNVFERIDADRSSSQSTRPVQVFLGDYVDRGAASREVIERLMERSHSQEVVLLRGNHEAMFLDFFDNPGMLDQWRQFGGLQTLISYGLKPSLKPEAQEQTILSQEFRLFVPLAHRKFIRSMPTSFTLGDFFFVHAGVRPGIALKDQKEDDLLWIREDFLLHERDFEKVVVHGHTPVREPEVHHNRINLDTGAYATGTLACMVIEGETIGFI